MRLKPPPGKRLVSDWRGLTVITRREMKNGMHTIPAGTRMKVDGVSPGLTLESEPCPHCGVSARISRVHPDSVVIA